MDTTITRRAWIYLVAMAAAVLLVVGALALAWRARADHARVQRLVKDDLVRTDSVAEARLLTLALQLEVARAALMPPGSAEAARFHAHQARLRDELRRARVHAHDPNTEDVIDDLDNRALGLGAAAEQVFAALAAGRPGQADAALRAVAQEGAQVNALADELFTLTTTATEQQARSLSGGWRPVAMLALAMAGLIFAVLAGALAWAESGPALVAACALVLPYSLVRRLTRDAADGYPERRSPSLSSPIAAGEGDDAFPDETIAGWAEEEHTAPTWGEGDQAAAAPPIPFTADTDTEERPRLLEGLGPQPPRTLTFDTVPTPEDQPQAEPAASASSTPWSQGEPGSVQPIPVEPAA